MRLFTPLLKTLVPRLCVLAGLVSPWANASAAEFSLYLKCTGKVIASGKSTAGYIDLALRDNNTTALVQRSNALPVGERMKYVASPMTYSIAYQVRGTGSVLVHDWMRGSLFVWQPSLKRVSIVRLSIDRQSGELTGDLANTAAESLAQLKMQCEPIKEEDLPAPKF